MKKGIIAVFLTLNCVTSKSQNRYRFNLAAIYAAEKNNAKESGSAEGIMLAEYYQPWYDINVFAGLSFEISKLQRLQRLYMPASFSIAYFGNKRAVVPVSDIGIGYGFYNNTTSTTVKKVHEKGGLYTTVNFGIAYNKWQSTPYITIGFSSFNIAENVSSGTSGLINNAKYSTKQLGFKLGFLFK